jgi:hypothetical protein
MEGAMSANDMLDPPDVWYVWNGESLYLPYPGGWPAGSEQAARKVADVNEGWQAVQMDLVFAEEGHQCVWEHTHSEPNFGAHYECRICEAKTP